MLIKKKQCFCWGFSSHFSPTVRTVAAASWARWPWPPAHHRRPTAKASRLAGACWTGRTPTTRHPRAWRWELPSRWAAFPHAALLLSFQSKAVINTCASPAAAASDLFFWRLHYKKPPTQNNYPASERRWLAGEPEMREAERGRCCGSAAGKKREALPQQIWTRANVPSLSLLQPPVH